MTAALSRRAALTGAVASVALVSTMPSAAVANTPGTVNPRLIRVIALHDRVDMIGERFEADICKPRREACLAQIAAAEAKIIRPVPHQRVTTTFINIYDDEVRLSTSTVGGDATAHRAVNDPSWADMGDERWRQAHSELAGLHDRRKGILAKQQARFAAAKERIEAAHGVAALRSRSNALSDRQWALWKEALTMPSFSIADVVAKLDFLDRTGGSDLSDYVLESLAADLRQLAKQEASA